MATPRLALLVALCLVAPHTATQQQQPVARGDDAAQAQGRQRQVHRITPKKRGLPGAGPAPSPQPPLPPPPPPLRQLKPRGDRQGGGPEGEDDDECPEDGVPVEFHSGLSKIFLRRSVRVTVLCFVNTSAPDYGHAALEAVAREEAGRAMVVYVPAEQPRWASIMRRFGVQVTSPCVPRPPAACPDACAVPG